MLMGWTSARVLSRGTYLVEVAEETDGAAVRSAVGIVELAYRIALGFAKQRFVGRNQRGPRRVGTCR